MFDNNKGGANHVRARTRWIRHENFEELTYLRKPSIRFFGTRKRGQEKSRALIASLARALNRRYIDGLGSTTQGWKLGLWNHAASSPWIDLPGPIIFPTRLSEIH
jgi:hypothetical protein